MHRKWKQAGQEIQWADTEGDKLTVGISSKWEMNLVHLRVDRGLIERADKEVHIMFIEAWNLILTVLLKRPQRDVSTLGLPSILPCGVQSWPPTTSEAVNFVSYTGTHWCTVCLAWLPTLDTRNAMSALFSILEQEALCLVEIPLSSETTFKYLNIVLWWFLSC